MARNEGHHQPVEKAPPVAGRAAEQPVHVRGQPQQAQIGRHVLDGTGRGAVDPDLAARRALDEAGAEIGRPVRRLDGRRHRPGRVGAQLHQRVEGGAPQAPPRRQQRHGFEEIGLARSVRPGQHHVPRVEIERGGGVVAEMGEAQAGDVGHGSE